MMINNLILSHSIRSILSILARKDRIGSKAFLLAMLMMYGPLLYAFTVFLSSNRAYLYVRLQVFFISLNTQFQNNNSNNLFCFRNSSIKKTCVFYLFIRFAVVYFVDQTKSYLLLSSLLFVCKIFH